MLVYKDFIKVALKVVYSWNSLCYFISLRIKNYSMNFAFKCGLALIKKFVPNCFRENFLRRIMKSEFLSFALGLALTVSSCRIEENHK
jgi:hypothetical protein